MKKRKSIKIFMILFAAAFLLLLPMQTLQANAGMSVSETNNSSITDGIDEGLWYLDGGVTGVSDSIQFNNSGSAVAKAVAKTRMRNLTEYGIDETGDINITLNISSLAEGSKFSIVFGLINLVSAAGTANTTEVYFVNNAGAFHFGICSFDATGIKNDLKPAAATAGIGLNTDMSFSIAVTASGGLTVIKTGVSDTVLYQADSGAYGDGYFGLFSATPGSGTNNITIKSINIKSFNYDNAFNPGSVTETFDNDIFNAEAWYCASTPGYYGSGYIKPEGGQLAMKNVYEGYFSTMHEYSNFELCFDITKMLREPLYDDAGNVTAPISNWFGISFGAAAYNSSFHSSVTQSVFFQFEPDISNFKPLVPVTGGRYILWDNYTALSAGVNFPAGQNLWKKSDIEDSEGRERAVSMKFVMTDGVFEVSQKYDDEQNWTQVFNYDLGYTPKGTVRILTYGTYTGDVESRNMLSDEILAGNLWIDNLSIKNTDILSENYITEIGFKSNFNGFPPPFEYTDTWNPADLIVSPDGKIVSPDDKKIIWPYIVFPIAGALLASAAVILVLHLKRNKNKSSKVA